MARAFLILPLAFTLILTACASEGDIESEEPELARPALIVASDRPDADPDATRDLEERLANQRVKVRVNLRASDFARWLRQEADMNAMLEVSAIEGHWNETISYANAHPLPWSQVLHDMLQPVGMRYRVSNGIIYVESAVNN